MNLDLVVRNGTVITMDPERRVLRGGAVGAAGGRIVAVAGAGEELPTEGRLVDATGRIVLPGIVDTHGHAGHCLTRGLGDGWDEPWMELMTTVYDSASDEAFWRAESRLAALERLKFGVTTSLSMTGSQPRIDDPRYALAAASGYAELGLRHIVASGPSSVGQPQRYTDRTVDPPRAVALDLDAVLRATGDVLNAVRGLGNERISAVLAPAALRPGPMERPETVTQLRGLVDLLGRHGVGFHSHAFGGHIQDALAIAPELFGPHASLAHCAGISMDEVGILAATGTAISHGPLTHAYAAARCPVVEALKAGVNVAISTDGTAPDRSFDLIAQARIAGQLQRAHFRDASLLPAGRLLAMITVDASRAIGMGDEVGSIEVGKRADLILIDARQAHLAPEILAPLRVVGHATGQDVDTVIVGGEILMEGRVVHGVDEAAILSEARDALLATLERTTYGDAEAIHPDVWRGLRYGDEAGTA